MATQLQKFNGNNIYNNRVYVDFKNKNIEFEPVKVGGRTVKKIKREFLAIHLTIAIHIFMFGFLAIIGITEGLLRLTGYNFLEAFMFAHIGGSLIALTKTYNTSMKEFKKNFPKRNASLLKLVSGLSTFGLKKSTKRKIVNPEAIIDNKWIIPKFGNVVLEYTATKDFAKQLKSIKIINIYQNRDQPFMAVFEFKKIPKNGKLYVDYLE